MMPLQLEGKGGGAPTQGVLQGGFFTCAVVKENAAGCLLLGIIEVVTSLQVSAVCFDSLIWCRLYSFGIGNGLENVIDVKSLKLFLTRITVA